MGNNLMSKNKARRLIKATLLFLEGKTRIFSDGIKENKSFLINCSGGVAPPGGKTSDHLDWLYVMNLLDEQ